MEILILSLFVCILLGCVIANLSIVYALLLGYVLFVIYSLKRGFSFRNVLKMSMQGIKAAKNILITFMLIGILTALWRAGGTIPAIVCYASKIMEPHFFVLITFLLNCLVSFLTGTAFGTAATMGSICMTMALALHLNPVMMGGAILSGVFFGDRCSPVSTSALLVAELTQSNLYHNIKNMLKTSAVPFLLTLAIYIVYSALTPAGSGELLDIHAVFSQEFRIGVIPLIPAALILVLSLRRVNVKYTMLASILASIAVCLCYQNLSPTEILHDSILGFTTANAELADMINGGGILSMLRVAAIVCISSSYAGIFQQTPLLDSIKQRIEQAGKKSSSYVMILITSILSSAIACNQTLAIMLTKQLCSDLEPDREQLAIDLENSAVIVAPLIPWSIAGGVPLASVGAPLVSISTAFFLFLLPLWNLITTRRAARTT